MTCLTTYGGGGENGVGQCVLTGGRDGVVRVWDVRDGEGGGLEGLEVYDGMLSSNSCFWFWFFLLHNFFLGRIISRGTCFTEIGQ